MYQPRCSRRTSAHKYTQQGQTSKIRLRSQVKRQMSDGRTPRAHLSISRSPKSNLKITRQYTCIIQQYDQYRTFGMYVHTAVPLAKRAYDCEHPPSLLLILNDIKIQDAKRSEGSNAYPPLVWTNTIGHLHIIII